MVFNILFKQMPASYPQPPEKLLPAGQEAIASKPGSYDWQST